MCVVQTGLRFACWHLRGDGLRACYSFSMFVFQTGRTVLAWLLLVASATSALVFGWLAGTRGDWLAGGLSLVCIVMAVRMVVLLLRRHALRNADLVREGVGQTRSASNGLFITRGFHSVGARFRKGVIVIAPNGAAFLPTSRWRFLPLEFFFASLLLRRFEFLDLVVDLPAHTDTNAALHAAAAKYDGFFIDDAWRWTAAQRWLSHPEAQGIVSLSQCPPAHITARWAAGALPSKAVLEQRLRVVASVGVALAILLTLAGAIAWQRTGETDYVVAASSYAAISMLIVVGVWFVARRRFRAPSV